MSKSRWAILIILILLGVGAYIYYKKVKRQKNKDLQALRTALKAGIGALGEDIDEILLRILPDRNFKLSDADLKKLADAKGYVYDSPQNFEQVLSGKTKAQIKALVIQYQNKTGKKLNDYINEVLADVTGYDTKEYQKILNIVKSAR